ncbi:hypothetical protein J4E90_004571 [Alternaria incomplexa]|uniref:uncharacterized protein n=1 Tax=Alternaria incomplexa TaxID=1187928 RepID=UPI002220BF93|nr:uncharacterized protein J4E90_004571 [Alternaria incomplexa]KAI4916125.1 hypothetical protein J4E90_004571 [Alternaria incomplexa]
MSFLHNLFSSPAKYTPAKKRNIPETPTPRSSEKRKRDAYDPEEYQNAVYAGAGAVTVSGDDGYEMDEDELDELDEVEAAAHQLQDEAEVVIAGEEEDDDEDDDDDTRPYATPKSVRKLSRDLYAALEARSPGRTGTHDKAGKTLAGTSTKVAISPSPSPSICTGSETENEENEGEAIDHIDWSSSDDDLQLSFSPTTSSAGLDVTSTGEIEVEVDRLKHKPVGKQHRPRAGAGRLNTTTTRHTATRPSTSSITPPPPQPPQSHRTMPSHTTTHPQGFENPRDWHEKTPEEKWDTQPNLRARELSSSPHRIRAELPSEPDYAFRDAEVRDGLWGLMSSIEDFAEEYFSKGAHAGHTTMTADGDRFVHKMFFESFDRNARYATTILAHLPTPTSLPYNFNAHVNTIIGALWTHLSPLLTLAHPPTYPASTPLPIPPPSLSSVFADLRRLTVSAGILSLHMHLDPHTAYHHVPLFKEDNYDSSIMECWNDGPMRQRNMRNKYEDVDEDEQKRRDALSETEKRRARGDTALTQIICFNGVTACRKGGWENGSSTASNPVYEKAEYKNMGVRVRVLTQGLVYCRWGRALSSQKTAEMDNETGKKIHGDAWRQGGFMQFTDVEGVFDWLGVERKEKADARKAVLERMAGRADAGAG